MTIGTMRKSLGVGIATLALLGGAASGVATADPAHTAGGAAHSSSAGKATAAEKEKKCKRAKGIGYYCGYYKGSATVRTGSKGNAVREVQALINQTTSYTPKLKVDGDFGSKTKKAVVWFQKTYNVKPYDGIVGPKTWKELRLK